MRYTRFAIPAGLLGCCILFVSGCGSIRWGYDVDRGLVQASQQHRRALVLFCKASSADCSKMDRQVFSDAKVRELVNSGFIPVRQDLVLNRKVAEQCAITEVPSLVILRPDGSIAATQTGAMDAEAFRVFLIKHRYN